MNIAIDLDGPLFKLYWTEENIKDYDNEMFGSPVVGAADAMRELRAAGHKIIIHTCRTNEELNPYKTEDELRANVANALTNAGIEFDEIWTGMGKPIAHMYIDDRAKMFHSWVQILSEIRDDV